MTYKCFIVDDEPLAIDVIASYLAKLKKFEISGKYTDSLEAFADLKENPVDLIFLDIEMPELTGLEFIRSIKYKPEIIITTAYREFAVEGFELNILDYLVKPIEFERFMQALDKFLDKVTPKQIDAQEAESHIMVRADRKNVRVALDDILYIEGLKDYVRIILRDGEVLTKESIGHFASHLDKNSFLRIHKSFIAAKNKITAYTNYDVEIGNIELPIGRVYKEQFLKMMQ